MAENNKAEVFDTTTKKRSRGSGERGATREERVCDGASRIDFYSYAFVLLPWYSKKEEEFELLLMFVLPPPSFGGHSILLFRPQQGRACVAVFYL